MEVCLSGKINGKRYGLVHHSVMLDNRLSIEARAIYSYLTTMADDVNEVQLRTDEFAFDLGISEPRLLRHRKQLIDLGYISINRIREDTGFGINVYTITHNAIERE